MCFPDHTMSVCASQSFRITNEGTLLCMHLRENGKLKLHQNVETSCLNEFYLCRKQNVPTKKVDVTSAIVVPANGPVMSKA